MLELTIIGGEQWDPVTEQFNYSDDVVIKLEHSLYAISKWEAKWKKPYLTREEKTYEESLDYIRCMTLTESVSPDVYNFVTADQMREISNYINDPQTATVIKEQERGANHGEETTSELIYYWMVASEIPFECQYWHLNRLMTLIRICGIKNNPKKMGKKNVMKQNTSLNAMRRQAARSKG